MKEKIKQAYIEYVLEHDRVPRSAYLVAKKAGVKEEEFYQHFSSVKALDNQIWLGFFEETKQRIEQEAVYASYSVREKILAFYYTFIEVLKANRSYVMYSYESVKQEPITPNPDFLSAFKPVFQDFIESLILEGRESQEIAERTSFLMDTYPRIFWWQLLLILRFWVNDSSQGFEKTDVFIEKAVNFGMDAVGKTTIDSAFDFAKFVFQNR